MLPALLVFLGLLVREARAHGYVIEPASRASAWRAGFDTPTNYEDAALNCGGVEVQYSQNGGRCGVCGDPWHAVREHEAGGTYATGTITKHYSQGQVVHIKVILTANHQGWFEFRLCPVNNKHVKATQECLDQNLLTILPGGTRYTVQKDVMEHSLQVRLPAHVTCTQCVLQWKYNTANSWGYDRGNEVSCLGCGLQEQFYACSDVAIAATGQPVPSIIQGQQTAGVSPSTDVFSLLPFLTSNLANLPALLHTSASSSSTQPQSPAPPPASASHLQSFTFGPETATSTSRLSPAPSHQTDLHKGIAQLIKQLSSSISSNRKSQVTSVPSSSVKDWIWKRSRRSVMAMPTPSPILGVGCRATGLWSTVPGMGHWCTINCNGGYCPSTHCICMGY